MSGSVSPRACLIGGPSKMTTAELQRLAGFDLIVLGWRHDDIAEIFGVSTRTVERWAADLSAKHQRIERMREAREVEHAIVEERFEPDYG